eukprot:2988810-Amphidinium_carterae.2
MLCSTVRAKRREGNGANDPSDPMLQLFSMQLVTARTSDTAEASCQPRATWCPPTKLGFDRL